MNTKSFMLSEPRTFIFFGPSGSGKGTQAKLLKDYLEKNNKERKVIYIETGQLFRDFISSNKSYTRDLTKNVMDQSGLIPEFMPIWIWSECLIKNLTGAEHLILDGLSRRKHEAPILDGAMKFYKRKSPVIIEIDVSREWAFEKLLKRGRKDDTPDGIGPRLDWYSEHVIPAVEYLSSKPDYVHLKINGEQTIEEVHQEILKIV